MSVVLTQNRPKAEASLAILDERRPRGDTLTFQQAESRLKHFWQIAKNQPTYVYKLAELAASELVNPTESLDLVRPPDVRKVLELSVEPTIIAMLGGKEAKSDDSSAALPPGDLRTNLVSAIPEMVELIFAYGRERITTGRSQRPTLQKKITDLSVIVRHSRRPAATSDSVAAQNDLRSYLERCASGSTRLPLTELQREFCRAAHLHSDPSKVAPDNRADWEIGLKELFLEISQKLGAHATGLRNGFRMPRSLDRLYDEQKAKLIRSMTSVIGIILNSRFVHQVDNSNSNRE